MLRAMLSLFRCQHRNISWPQGRVDRATVVCFDCTRRLPYDWTAMALGKRSDRVEQQERAAEVLRG